MIKELIHELNSVGYESCLFDNRIDNTIELLRHSKSNKRLIDFLNTSSDEIERLKLHGALYTFVMEDARRGDFDLRNYVDVVKLNYFINHDYIQDLEIGFNPRSESDKIKLYLDLVNVFKSESHSVAFFKEYCLKEALFIANQKYEKFHDWDPSNIDFHSDLFDVLIQLVKNGFYKVVDDYFIERIEFSVCDWRCYALLFLMESVEDYDHDSYNFLFGIFDSEFFENRDRYCDLEKITLMISTIFKKFGNSYAAELESEVYYEKYSVFVNDDFDLTKPNIYFEDGIKLDYISELIKQEQFNEVQVHIAIKISEYSLIRQYVNKRHNVDESMEWCMVKSCGSDINYYFFLILAKVLADCEGSNFPLLKKILNRYKDEFYKSEQNCICKIGDNKCNCYSCAYCSVKSRLIRFFLQCNKVSCAAYLINFLKIKDISPRLSHFILNYCIRSGEVGIFKIIGNLSSDTHVVNSFNDWIKYGSDFSRLHPVDLFIVFLKSLENRILKVSFFMGFIFSFRPGNFEKIDLVHLLENLPDEDLLLILLEKFQLCRWIEGKLDVKDFHMKYIDNLKFLFEVKRDLRLKILSENDFLDSSF